MLTMLKAIGYVSLLSEVNVVNCVLTSVIPPLLEGETTISLSATIKHLLSEASVVDIAVGYVSVEGLDELKELVRANNHLQKINLIIGMYYFAGIPKSIYLKVQQLQKEWGSRQIGSIWFVTNMQYHGKLYLFQEGPEADEVKPYKAVIGSANLSILENVQRRQYELGATVDNAAALRQLVNHVNELREKCCVKVDDKDKLQGLTIVSEQIKSLNGITDVFAVSQDEVNFYKQQQTSVSFTIPIKAPAYNNRFSNNRTDFARSNINVCYGNGRLNPAGKYVPRSWYEVQITVSRAITERPEYPANDRPFWIITDDGYKFEAHTTAANHKQLTAFVSENNDKVFGRWIKGRLATAGYVKPVDNVNDDTNRQGVITAEMLEDAKMSNLVLTKTNLQTTGRLIERNWNDSHQPVVPNEFGLLDVWTAEFAN